MGKNLRRSSRIGAVMRFEPGSEEMKQPELDLGE
jgi:hypothetical protein